MRAVISISVGPVVVEACMHAWMVLLACLCLVLGGWCLVYQEHEGHGIRSDTPSHTVHFPNEKVSLPTENVRARDSSLPTYQERLGHVLVLVLIT